MNTGIKLLDKYTSHYYKLLKAEGHNVEYGDVQSELSIVYTRALNAYKPKVDGDNKLKAEFETYTVKTFQRAMIKFRRRIGKAALIDKSRVDVDPDNTADDSGSFPDGEYTILDAEVKAEFLNLFEGQTFVVAKELIDPSDKVLKALNASLAKFCGCGKGRVKLNGIGGLPKAIGSVYGMNLNTVRWHIRKIQEKAKKWGKGRDKE